MSEPSQPVPQTPSEKLRAARAAFALSAAKGLADLDGAIADAERLERQQRLDAALREFMPGEDKAVLKGHDFDFLLNNTKSMGHGPASPLGVAVAAAHKIYSTVAGTEGISVAAHFWGGKVGALMEMRLNKGPGAYDTTPAEAKDLFSAAKELLAVSASDSQKHYIIVCDGDIAGNIDHTGAVLEAAARINPKATFDFIVCSTTETTGVDTLVQRWSKVAATKLNLVKVGTAEEITGAVMNVAKARLSGTAYKAPAPAVKAPAGTPTL